MRIFLIGLLCFMLSCNNKSSKTETTKDDSSLTKKDTIPPPLTDTLQGFREFKTQKELIIEPVEYPGNVAYAVFQKDGKTLFYYNVDTKKGYITLNGKKYNFDSYTHQINEPDYKLTSGSDLTIKVEGTEFSDYENPEPGILKGKAKTVYISLESDNLVLTNVDVIDGTNAD